MRTASLIVTSSVTGRIDRGGNGQQRAQREIFCAMLPLLLPFVRGHAQKVPSTSHVAKRKRQRAESLTFRHTVR